MFQISTAKFFDKDKITRHDGQFVFFSNVKCYLPIALKLPDMKINLIDYSGGVSCYLVEYKLLTETPDKIEPGVVIRAGDQDYIQQFILLWEFYFKCVARKEKEDVKSICTQINYAKHYGMIALEVAPHIVALDRHIEHGDVEGFVVFINDVVEVDRKAFKSIIASLKIISDSKESLSTNFDLTYSMLVYALESLSQRNDGYISKWEDYDQEVRLKLENVFKSVGIENSVRIKDILIEGKQFKLLKRFKEFILSCVDDEFYHHSSMSAIRKSHMERTLDNLYKMRSSFVHELKPLDVMISESYSAESDCVMRLGEPYFTYSGLLRLLDAVIRGFSKKNYSNLAESINWVQETSSVRYMEMSAEYWVWNPNVFDIKKIYKWYSEYLCMLNVDKVIDMREVVSKICEKFDSSPLPYKSALLYFYCLYNSVHCHDDLSWASFAEKRKEHLKVDIYLMVNNVYLYHELFSKCSRDETIENLREFMLIFNDYDRNKFKKNSPSLPAITEAILLSAAANLFYKNGYFQDYKQLLNRALCEISSEKLVFDYIYDCLSGARLISIKSIFDIIRSKGS